MTHVLTAALATTLLATTVLAQTTQRKPGPEHKRIAYFAGEWKFEGESKPSPMSPGGKVSGTETCEWFEGGFHLVCRSKGTGPLGPVTGQSVMGYDQGEKTYTYYGISSLGDNFFVRGHADGKVWSWQTESKVEGKLMKARVTVTEESPTAYMFRMEASFDGGPMAVIEEGKATKVK